MADVVTIVETAGTAVAATAAVGGALSRRFIKAHDTRVLDDLFLHGRSAAPGLPEILPAGDRLSSVEVGVQAANRKIDTANSKLDTLVGEVSFQLRPNGGDSIRDKIEQIANEQSRVADALANGHKEGPK